MKSKFLSALLLCCTFFISVAHARDYDATTGRFISADPDHGKITTPATLNRYTYAQNDPVNKTDPSGRVTLTELETVQDDMVTMRAEASANFSEGLAQEGGTIMQDMGAQAERTVGRMIRDCLKPRGVEVGRITGSKKTIDFLVTMENQVLRIEAKSKIPNVYGAALRRLKDQLLANKAAGQGLVTVIGAESEGSLALTVKYLTRAGLKQGLDFDLIQGLVSGAQWMGEIAMEACI